MTVSRWCGGDVTGEMPSVAEANAAEPLRLWGGSGVQGRVVLGAHVDEACLGASQLGDTLSVYGDEPFAITYRCSLKHCGLALVHI